MEEPMQRPRRSEKPAEDAEMLPVGEFVAIEVELLMLEPAIAKAMLCALDLALHPWGAPGVVPTEPGEYWLDDGVEDEPWPVTILAYVLNQRPYVSIHNEAQGSPDWSGKRHFFDESDELFSGFCFRRRWTPEGPVTP